MAISYTSGLNFSSPSKGDTDWDVTEAVKDLKLSAHDHTGAGKGLQIGTSALAANAADATIMRLANNTAFRGRNAAGSADIELFKPGTDNLFDLLAAVKFTSVDAAEITATGAIPLTTTRSILNGASIAMTLADGVAGQIKLIVNKSSTGATVTPATTVLARNAVRLHPGGAVLYWFNATEWYCIPGTGCVLFDDTQVTIATSGTYSITGQIFTFNNAGATTATFSAGATGQRVTVYNIGAGTVTLTLTGRPAASDVLTITTGGIVELVMIDSNWQPIAGSLVAITYA